MGDIITPEEFDKIFDRIVDPDKLKLNMLYMSEANSNMIIERFLSKNCYKVYYENQLFYILTDSYISSHEEGQSYIL